MHAQNCARSSTHAIRTPAMRRARWTDTRGAHAEHTLVMQVSSNSGSLYYNYTGFYSVVLMALVDADYKFSSQRQPGGALFFVGDDAFALRPDMMKPYNLRGMTRPFAGCALSARCMRASCAGHSFSAPATRCALVDFLKRALCMRYACALHTPSALATRCACVINTLASSKF